MRGMIQQIHNLKPAKGAGLKNYGSRFIRITFKMDDGSWAKTDVCPEYRNFNRWKKIIKAGEGIVVDGLQFRASHEVNADSPAKIARMQRMTWQDNVKCKDCKGKGADQFGNVCQNCDGAGWFDPKSKNTEIKAKRFGTSQTSLFKGD
jgi:predicted nucleic acid-binding Zn ribbon protein